MGSQQQIMMAHTGAAGATFPTNGVLDDFQRADTGPPPGSNWGNGIFTTGGWITASNEATSAGGTNSAYWNVSNFGPNVEVYAKITSTGDVRLYWRVTGEGTAAATGYFIYRTGSIIQVYRQDNGSITQIGTDYSQAFSVGDSIGATHVSGTITVWFKAGAGSWTSLGTRGPDTTYNSAGKIGMYGASALDDFGGGTI